MSVVSDAYVARSVCRGTRRDDLISTILLATAINVVTGVVDEQLTTANVYQVVGALALLAAAILGYFMSGISSDLLMEAMEKHTEDLTITVQSEVQRLVSERAAATAWKWLFAAYIITGLAGVIGTVMGSGLLAC